LLIPGKEAAVRTPLMRWLDVRQLKPRIVGEFDDTALMQASVKGTVFIAPSVITGEVQREHGVVVIGQTDGTEHFTPSL
jgi:LysR family transcriptional activator of nhaA